VIILQSIWKDFVLRYLMSISILNGALNIAVLIPRGETGVSTPKKLQELESHTSRFKWISSQQPSRFVSRDSRAIMQALQGLQLPHHITFQGWLTGLESFGTQASDLAKIARRAERYLKQRHKMKGRSVSNTDGKIFIDHGRSGAWRELQDFIQNRLGFSRTNSIVNQPLAFP
jgi:hypothetical protein